MNASQARQTVLARLARFDASTVDVLARLDVDAAQLDALAERLCDEGAEPCSNS